MNLNPFYSSGPSALFGGLLALLKGSEGQHQAQSGALDSTGQGNPTPLGESEPSSQSFDAILSKLAKTLESSRATVRTDNHEAAVELGDNPENSEIPEFVEVIDDSAVAEGAEESELPRAEAGREVQVSISKDVRVNQGLRIPGQAPDSIAGQQDTKASVDAGQKIIVNTGGSTLPQPLSNNDSQTLNPTQAPVGRAGQAETAPSQQGNVPQPVGRQSLSEQLEGQVSAKTESLGQKASQSISRPQNFAPLSSEVTSGSTTEPLVQTGAVRQGAEALPPAQSSPSSAIRSNPSVSSAIILPQAAVEAPGALASPARDIDLSAEPDQAKISRAEVAKASVPEFTPTKNLAPSQNVGSQVPVLELDPVADGLRNAKASPESGKPVTAQEAHFTNGKEVSVSETAAGNRSISKTNQSSQHSLSLPENLAVEEALVRTGGDLVLNQNKAIAKPERQDLGGDENIRSPQTPQAKLASAPAPTASANSTPVDVPELDSLRVPVDSRSTSQEKAELPQKSIPVVPARVQPSSDPILSKTNPGVVLDPDSGLEIRNVSKSTEATGSVPVKSQPLEISSPAAVLKTGGNEALSAGKAQPEQSLKLPTVNTRDTSIETSKPKIVDLPPSVSGSPRGQAQAQPTSLPAVQAASSSSDLAASQKTNPEVSKAALSEDQLVPGRSRVPAPVPAQVDGEPRVQQERVSAQAARTVTSATPESDANRGLQDLVLSKTQSPSDSNTNFRSASQPSMPQDSLSRTAVQGQVLETPRPESAGQPENGNAKAASPSPRGLSFESTQREAGPLQKTQSANRSFDSNFAEPTVRSDATREPALASAPAPGEDQQILQNQISSAQSPPVPNQNLGEVQGSSLSRLPGEMAALGDLVVKQVSRAMVEGTTKDVTEIRLALHPEALGYLHITLRVEKKGEVFAYMRASSQEAADALTRGIDQLKESLLEKGLELTEFEVSVGDFSLDSGPDSFSFDTPNSSSNSLTDSDSDDDSSPLLRIQAPTSLLDVLA